MLRRSRDDKELIRSVNLALCEKQCIAPILGRFTLKLASMYSCCNSLIMVFLRWYFQKDQQRMHTMTITMTKEGMRYKTILCGSWSCILSIRNISRTLKYIKIMTILMFSTGNDCLFFSMTFKSSSLVLTI